jgi:hypothetical protein
VGGFAVETHHLLGVIPGVRPSEDRMHRTRRALALSLAAAAALGGCTATRSSNVVVTPGQLISPGSKVFLLAVPDGVERRGGVAAGSGLAVAVGLRDALFAKGFQSLQGDSADLDMGLAEAERLGYDYVVRAAITQWEDNTTQWSGVPDAATLSVALYDARRRALIATSNHTVEGSVGDYRARTPDRFIPELVDHCLGALLGWTPSVVTPR